MMNNVVLVGRLTKDPEIRYSPNGKAVCRYTLAINRSFTNTNGEKDADFISCVSFGKVAENLANYQEKGSLIGVVGRIQTGSYENQQGQRVYTTDVVGESVTFLEPPKKGKQNGQGQQQQWNQNYQGQGQFNNGNGQWGNQPNNNQWSQQPQQQFGQGQQGGQPQGMPNPYGNYSDPFAGVAPSGNDPIDVSEDDLPF